MSYQVLARKWRPKKFEDVVGQEHIIKSLQNSLKEERFGHAYIFSGTRGIGKTTIARMFAKSLRCENRLDNGNACGACGPCEDFNTNSSMDVIEIDGASNNSVDDVRDLISNVQYLPATGKYKVYIIDEVHMLSTSAFNALLKTLEEPPEHVIFLMATTEPEKLLGTVLSRCQRFDFRNASVENSVGLLTKICEAEGITYENNLFLTELAKLGNGSFRDTLSLLDQVLSFSIDKNITEDTFAKSLGLAKVSAIKDIISAIALADVQTISDNYKQMISENISVKNIVHSLLDNFFSIVASKDRNDFQRVESKISEEAFNALERSEAYWIYEIMVQDFTWALSSIVPSDAVEMVMRKVALRHEFMASTEKKTENLEVQTVAVETSPVVEEPVVAGEPVENIVQQEAPVQEMSSPEPVEEKPEQVKKIKIEIPEVVETVAEATEEAIVETKEDEVSTEGFDKNWEGFVDFLNSISPVAASNLEQSNLVKPISFNGEVVEVNLGFPESAKVFFDYLNEQESYEKLRENLSKFFKVSLENVSLQMDLIEREKAEETKFQSKFEKKIEEEKIEKEQQIESIETDPLIQHAESIFGSKVDKVLLNNKK